MMNTILLVKRGFLLTLLTLCVAVNFLTAQVAVNADGATPDASAMLDVKSSDKGLLIPRLTTTARNTLAATAVAGLMVYDTDLDKFFFFNGVTWEEGSTGSLWTENGSGNSYLTNLTGMIGIGKQYPTYQVDVYNSSGASWLRTKSATGFAGLLIDKGSKTDNGYLIFRTTGVDKWFAGTIANNNFSISTQYDGTGDEFYIDSTGLVGIGTNTPQRTLEVNGHWRTARLSTSYSGSFLEFVGADATDWSIGSWGGSMRILSSTDEFSTSSDEYLFYTTTFQPSSANTKTLGSSSSRWSTLYSAVGNFNSTGSGIAGATVYSVNTGTAGIAGYFESNGTDAAMVVKQTGTGKFLKAFGPNGGNEELGIDNDGTISLYNGSYIKTIQIDPYEGTSTDGGQITMYNSSGAVTIEIDGDYIGDGRITTQELQITGGSDLSEFFDLTAYDDIQKGMVVCIDEEHPGHLAISQSAYDRKVAGIVSGANNIEPGLIMSQKGTIADGEHLIALSGRVYCMVDATEKPVKIGDMLTTSGVPGHAMKVEDYDKARGAIIGKAMTSLDSGKGLVLVLVSLQ